MKKVKEKNCKKTSYISIDISIAEVAVAVQLLACGDQQNKTKEKHQDQKIATFSH